MDEIVLTPEQEAEAEQIPRQPPCSVCPVPEANATRTFRGGSTRVSHSSGPAGRAADCAAERRPSQYDGQDQAA
jgi:hypothetical protein